MEQTTGPTNESTPVDKTSFIWKAFSALLNNEDFRASDEDLVNFCVEELNVKLEKLRPILINNLPAIVVAYMNMWPGWHSKDDFQLGKIKIGLYFDRFKKFVMFKMRTLYKSQGQNKFVINSLWKQEMQKPLPPFAVSIQCPPRFVNTLVFADEGGMCAVPTFNLP